MDNKNPQDVANQLAKLLTPEVISQLLNVKPTKKQYLAKLAKTAPCYKKFIENNDVNDENELEKITDPLSDTNFPTSLKSSIDSLSIMFRASSSLTVL